MSSEYHDMLQAYAIGCLKEENYQKFKQYLKSANPDFLLELGEYQNLISLLPSVNNFEIPSAEVKERLKTRLLNKKLSSNLDIVLETQGKQRTNQNKKINKVVQKSTLQKGEQTKIREQEFKKDTPAEIKNEKETVEEVTTKSEALNEDKLIQEVKTQSKKENTFVVVKDEKLLDEEFFNQKYEPVKSNKGWYAAIIIFIIFIITATALFLTYFNQSFQIDEGKKKIEELQTELKSTKTNIQSVEGLNSLIEAPDFILVNLQKASSEQTGYGKILSSASRGESFFYISNIPVLPDGYVYKLWIGKKKSFQEVASFYAVSKEEYKQINLPALSKGLVVLLTQEIKPETDVPGSKVIMWGEVN